MLTYAVNEHNIYHKPFEAVERCILRYFNSLVGNVKCVKSSHISIKWENSITPMLTGLIGLRLLNCIFFIILSYYFSVYFIIWPIFLVSTATLQLSTQSILSVSVELFVNILLYNLGLLWECNWNLCWDVSLILKAMFEKRIEWLFAL